MQLMQGLFASRWVQSLETGADEALAWIDYNFMFANLDKFQAMISKKDKTDTKDLEIRVGMELIRFKEQIFQLGISIDNKLSYNMHISEQIKKASAKLNAIKRMGNFLSQGQNHHYATLT